jgi:hypothetical protein
LVLAEFIRCICGIGGKLRAGKSIVDVVVVNLNGVLHKVNIQLYFSFGRIVYVLQW